MSHETMGTTKLCDCGKGPILCQGECRACRVVSEVKYCADNGLTISAHGVGQVYGAKNHKLVARRVVWGGVQTLRWVATCQVSSRGYGSNTPGAEVTCKRCV